MEPQFIDWKQTLDRRPKDPIPSLLVLRQNYFGWTDILILDGH